MSVAQTWARSNAKDRGIVVNKKTIVFSFTDPIAQREK